MKDYTFKRMIVANMAYIANRDQYNTENIREYGIMTVGSYEMLA